MGRTIRENAATPRILPVAFRTLRCLIEHGTRLSKLGSQPGGQ
jgi:hypothetical protein